MATFISLITETQVGETHIEQSVDRAARFREQAAKFGAKVTATYWTMGAYDGVLIFEADDDEKAAALLYHLVVECLWRRRAPPRSRGDSGSRHWQDPERPDHPVWYWGWALFARR